MVTKEPRDPELVQVFDTQRESEAMVVQGLLESRGIETLISGRDATQEVLPGVGGVIVRVPAERADEARQIIAEQLQEALAEDSEVSEESGPPA